MGNQSFAGQHQSEDVRDQDFFTFIQQMKKLTSIDLSQYKEAQMKRRLTTLRIKRGYDTFGAYFQAIKQDTELLNEFLDRMTINVSEFWRNPNRWMVLKDVFLPAMLKENPRLKCWSAACSTGEEPYTLAMILAELKGLQSSQIIASDLDQMVLNKAMQGLYPERSLRDVPPEFKRTYFKEQIPLFKVDDQLKKHIKFEKMDLLHDAYGSQYDLIICRNVMIYFTEEAKHKMYMNFSKALKPGGILFVGSTEQIFSPAQYNLDSVETFFYRKK
ncbi:CheR family methyltransferase [Marinicrinis sediminis]|uniref:protein-glutamate O-methyltransferase n=1 Tax=Marinicrinis sediminis TaxID=1652465 RepID=A0ABW5RD61_9BACL